MKKFYNYLTRTGKKHTSIRGANTTIAKSLCVLLFLFFMTNTVFGQTVASYNFSQTSGTYTPITGGTLFGSNTDNAVYGGTANLIPFSFTFKGTAYTSLKVSTNGFLTLGSATSPTVSTYAPLSASSNALYTTISAFSRDLNSTVRYEVLGTSPNRVAVIQWSNVYRYVTSTLENMSFQVRLYETSNNIEIVYGTMTNANTTYGTGGVQVGLRGGASDYNNVSHTNATLTGYSYTQNWNNLITTSSNTNLVGCTSTIMPASGLTLLYTPSTCAQPVVSATATSITASSFTANWTNNASYTSGYNIRWRKVDELPTVSTWATPTSVIAGSSSYIVNGLLQGTYYIYSIEGLCSGVSRSNYSTVTVANLQNDAGLVQTILACSSFPTALISSTITTTEATISWTAPASAPANGYEYYFSTSAIAPTAGTVGTAVTAGTTTVNLTGLTAATPYYYWVRTNCNGTDKGGWTAGTSFVTACMVPNPTGTISASAISSVGSTLAYAAASPAPSNYILFYTTGAANTAVPTLVNGTSYVNGTAYTALGGGINYTCITNTSVSPSVLSAGISNTQYNYFLFSKSTTSSCFGFPYYSSPQTVSVTTCAAAPTAPTVSLITTSGATVSWTASVAGGGVGAISYTLEVCTDAAYTTPIAGSPFTGLSGNSQVLTGLSASTTYYYRIKANNTFCDSTYITGNFVTSCAAVTTFPSTFDFSTYLPSICWFEGNLGDNVSGPSTQVGDNSDWVVDGFLNVGATGAAKMNIDTANGSEWLITPYYTIPTGYRMKYSVGATNFGALTAVTNWESDDYVEVLVSTNNVNWTVLKTYNSSNVPSYLGQIDTIDLSAYASQTVHFAFKAFEGTTNGAADIDFFVDNLIVEVIPSCFAPTALVTTLISSTDASHSWTAPSPAPAVGYEWAVSTSATPPASGTSSTLLTAASTGLTPNTTYYLHVRSDCGVAGTSAWATSSFYTGYCMVTTTTQASYISAFSTTGGSTNITHTAAAGFAGGYQNLSATDVVSNFVGGPTTAFAITSGGPTVGNAIWVDWNSNLIFETAERMYVSTGYGTTVSGTIAIPNGTAIGTYRMRVVTDFNNSAPSNPCNIPARGEYKDFGFAVVAPPTCPDPSALTATAVTNTAATISWSAGSNVGATIASHQYYISTSATPPTAGTTPTGIVAAGTNTVNLTGLTANTPYYYWVRANCTVNQSTWVSSGSFTSTNQIYSVYTTSNPKSINDVIDIYFEDLDPNVDFYTSGQTNVWMYAGVDTGAGNWGYTGPAYGIDSNNTGQLVNFAQTATTGLYKATIKLADYFCVPASVGTVYGLNMIFRNQYGLGGNNLTNDLYLDLTDAAVVVTVPTAVASTSITNISATLSWTAPVQGSNKGYEYAYSTTNSTPTSGTSIAATTISLTGLTPSTTYYYWVRTKGCGSDVSTWISGQFTSSCQTPVLTGVAASRCGTGTVNLAVTSDIASTVNWFTAVTGGSIVAGGSNTLSFTTPSLSNTTSYWAEGYTLGGAVETAGKAVPVSATGSLSTGYGIRFNVTKGVQLNSTVIYPVGTGTVTIELYNSSGVTLATSPSIAVTGTGLATPVTVPLGFYIPIGTGYRLALKAYSGITDLVRDSSNTFPYSGASLSVTAGWTTSTSTNYYYFYDLKLTPSCTTSPRVEVVATVTPAPAVTLSSTSETVCAGSNSSLVTLSGAGVYDTFVWSPNTNVSGDAASGYTFNPSVTTTYTLTASQNTGSLCNTSANFSYIATPAPTAVDITNTNAVVCLNKLQTITVSGNSSISILKEGFEANPNPTFAIGSSGSGAVYQVNYATEGAKSVRLYGAGDLDWLSGYTRLTSVNSVDLTQYSSATLTFDHICASESGYDFGYVQYSTDGGTTWASFPVSSYLGTGTLKNSVVSFDKSSYSNWGSQFTSISSTPGTAPATALFQSETINLSSYLLSANFKVRFRLSYDDGDDYYGWIIDNVKVNVVPKLSWTASNASLFTDAAGTLAYTAPGTYPTTIYAKPTAYNAVITATATLGTCSKSDSVSYIAAASTYNPSTGWDVAPAANRSLVFNDSYTVAANLSACDCTINSGTVTVNPGVTLSLINGITQGGSLVFQNNSSLLQENTSAINTGTITYNRTTTALNNNYDFVYWSSPVANQLIKNIWMTTANDTFYKFDPSVSDWAYVAPSTSMTAGVGYIARTQNNTANPTSNNTSTWIVGTTWNAPFIGIPNNGNSISLSIAAGDNLIGNPYPSGLDLNALTDDNAALSGIYNYWTHNTAISSNQYTGNDYANYVRSTGTGTNANTTGGGANASLRYAAAGQAFFAEGKSGGGTVTFKNAQRVGSPNNANFYRTAATAPNSFVEHHSLWLNLQSATATQGFKQQVLGYAAGASNGYDASYDAQTFDGNTSIDFYSIMSDKKLVQQFRDLSFNDSDSVPLGFKTSTADTFSISIDNSGTNGSFWYSSQPVYLQDNALGVVHNLTNTAYTFTSGNGTFDNRFVLKYTSALGTDNNDILDNTVIVAKDKNVLKVRSSIEDMKSITIFDMLGRKVYAKDAINNKEFSDVNVVKNNQSLIVKISLTNGAVVTKKIIF